MNTVVFVEFPANVVERNVTLGSVIEHVSSINLMSLVVNEPIANPVRTVVVLQIDGSIAAVSSEGLSGFPVPMPVTFENAATRQCALQFSPPVVVAQPQRTAMQSIRIRLANADGSSFTHSGVGLHLVLHSPPSNYDVEAQRHRQWVDVSPFSGRGTNDHRWDFVPSQDEVDAHVSRLYQMNVHNK